MTEALKYKVRVRELELNAILEITQAINSNLPEDSLYKIYNFTLRSNLNISKLALYVLEDTWRCRVNFGTETDFTQRALPFDKLSIREVTALATSATDLFGEFSLAIPVFHNGIALAYVFVSELKTNASRTDTNTAFIQTLTNIIAVAVENKKLARRQLEQESLNKEMEIARFVQKLLFPKELPYNEHLKVKADYFPHRVVGGDYYDFIEMDQDCFMFCIADVSGKGVPAALLMSNFQASLRVLVRHTTNLTQIVRELNHIIYQNAGGENFITFFGAIYDPNRRRLVYVNAGHNPPIYCDQAGGQILLKTGTTILGAFRELPFLEETEMEEVDEFLLFAYTDGLVETCNHKQEEYGLERIAAYIDKHQTDEPEVIHKTVMAMVGDFCEGNPYADDVTLLTCKVSR